MAELRRLLRLHHGHDGLYGDDGEMQCACCPLDFKRDSVERISTTLAAAVHLAAAAPQRLD